MLDSDWWQKILNNKTRAAVIKARVILLEYVLLNSAVD